MMEASRKPKTSVAEKLDEFKARYPRDKFLWVNAPLETAGDWPEHYGLGARCFKVPTDNLVRTESKKGNVSVSNSWIYQSKSEGVYGLHSAAKRQIMSDAGITFPRDRMKRLDDGTDPNICELEGAAAILALGEIRMVTGTYKIDGEYMNIPQQYVTQNCETRLEVRLGWKLLGIPQTYMLSELKAKEFVTFCIFRDYHPRTDAEHELILRHMLGIYGPAFGGAATVLEIGSAEQPRQLAAGNPNDCEVQEVEDDLECCDGPPSSDSSTPRQEPTETPAPAEPVRLQQAPLDAAFLEATRQQKRELCNLLGGEQGAAKYYEVLKGLGYEHANQVGDKAHKAAIYRTLQSRIKALAAKPPAPAPAPVAAPPAEDAPLQPVEDPLAPYFRSRRASLERMSIERLSGEIDGMVRTYPQGDPLDILPRFAAARDKAQLVEIAMELFAWQVQQSATIREGHNGARGGASR